MDLLPKARRVTEDSGPLSIRRESESEPSPKKSNGLNWGMIAFWGFVIFTFAGLFFALYVIWAKCKGD